MTKKENCQTLKCCVKKPAAQQLCSSAALQLCSSAALQLSSSAALLLCSSAALLLSCSAAQQLYCLFTYEGYKPDRPCQVPVCRNTDAC